MIENPYINPPEVSKSPYLEELEEALENEVFWLQEHKHKLELLEAYRIDLESFESDLNHVNVYLQEHGYNHVKQTDVLYTSDYTVDKLKCLIEDKIEDIRQLENEIERVKENEN